jgi:hypothetical protein
MSTRAPGSPMSWHGSMITRPRAWVTSSPGTGRSRARKPQPDHLTRGTRRTDTKRHTLKTEYVVTAEGRIASVSDSHPGSRHDLTIRREGAKLPRSARVYADSAYQGLEREHPMVEVPYKKRKGGDLSVEEKAYNRGLGSFRVAIEHRIGRTKRFLIVAER